MKGEIFIGFIELVEREFGEVVADRILSDKSLASGGSYTRVASYDHMEMIRLVVSLAEISEADPALLQRTFGKYLFGRLADWHPDFVAGYTGSFELLETIQDAIHVNVHKLYPDAETPSLTVTRVDRDTLGVEYESARGFAHVCHGLLEGCVAFFGENTAVSRTEPSSGPLEMRAGFRLVRR